MRLYFFSPLITSTEIAENVKTIINSLRSAGVFVVASSDENNTDFKKEDLERMNETGEILLDKMDGIIVEASKPDQEIGYLLAYAISQKKPLLYLYQKGTPEKVAQGYLTKKNTPQSVSMKGYAKSDLVESLLNWVATQGISRQEKPNIKFTLRITPQIERYLNWKSKKRKLAKADFLRELIEEIIKKDEEFKG
jgi:nicotinamidase-related amidase